MRAKRVAGTVGECQAALEHLRVMLSAATETELSAATQSEIYAALRPGAIVRNPHIAPLKVTDLNADATAGALAKVSVSNLHEHNPPSPSPNPRSRVH